MRQCSVLRVFTKGDVGGNHLGVVTDVRGLDGAAMQEIAAHLAFSETIFIDAPEGATPSVRIFTPAAELPFAGHPLVGAAWVLGSRRSSGAGLLRCGIGEIRYASADDGAEVEAPLVTDVDVADDGARIARETGFPPPRSAWWARMPIPYLVLEYDDPESVGAARPVGEKLAAEGSVKGMYLIASAGGDRVKARFFAPALGVFEDPATGSAAAALAAVRSFCGTRSGALTIDQGDEVGHPSTIGVAWDTSTCRLMGTVRRDEMRDIDW